MSGRVDCRRSADRSTLASLTAADLGRRITLTGPDVADGFREGVLVRIDHDLTWDGEATTFVGFQVPDQPPGVWPLQVRGTRRPSTDPVTIHPPQEERP